MTYWLDQRLHGGGLFHGALDEVRVYDVALDAESIAASYAAERAGAAPSDASSERVWLRDDFDDRDPSVGPAWTLEDDDDAVAGRLVNDGTARFVRTSAGGNGGAVVLSLDVHILVSGTTQVTFDVRVDRRTVGAGCGWTCREYPANVELFVENARGDETRLRYAFNYGTELEDQVLDGYVQVATPLPQGAWVRDLNFRVRDTVPDAETITRVRLYANGWDFDGAIDDLVISD